MERYKIFVPIRIKKDGEWYEVSRNARLVYALLASIAAGRRGRDFRTSANCLEFDLFKEKEIRPSVIKEIKKGIFDLRDIHEEWIEEVLQNEWIVNSKEITTLHKNIIYTYVYPDDMNSLLDHKSPTVFKIFYEYTELLSTFSYKQNIGDVGDCPIRLLSNIFNRSNTAMRNTINKFIAYGLLCKIRRSPMLVVNENGEKKIVQPSNIYVRAGDKDKLSNIVH